MAFNGWYNRLYTVTGQYIDDDDSEKYRPQIEKGFNKEGQTILYLVFEYMDTNLKKFIRRHRSNREKIPAATVKILMYQLCKGVAFVHGRGVLHRDLKPRNLLMDCKTMSLKIANLSLNQHTSSEEDFPSTDLLHQSITSAPPPLSTIGNFVDVADGNEVPLPEKKECDYRNGKWVSDNRRPLYSGFGCKHWLSESWSCRLTQRTDFAYEKFRWQPEACEMPEFEASQFLGRMQDKTIAYVGDSLGRQMFQSMMCMVTGGKQRPDVEDVGAEYGFVLAPDRATSYAMHLGRPPAFLKNNLHIFHVLVLNTGHHWNRGKLRANKWEMYLGGAPNNNRNISIIWKVKNFIIHSIVKWMDAQLPRHPQLKVFYRTISPWHFFNGDWNTGGSRDNTNPLAKGSGIHLNHSKDSDAEGAVRGTRIKLLDVTALSRLRDEGHISR
ncbi:unnamed protein product [Miscanthus lutarioriparius]|uniref:Protein kinase domain-containing protein n=1 Tax=Miscanthus lutarioriparius TaxID=422564 RepID=A0A811R3T5_9POAL|nr:unnamed protein product [Miscanthus lutarioriparius]